MLTLWLAGTLLASSPIGPPQTLEVNGQTLYIDADHVHINLPDQRVLLAGDALLRYQDLTLRADRIEGDYQDAERITASAVGGVSLSAGDGVELEAARLSYNFADRRGLLTDARIRVPLDSRGGLSDLMRPEERPKWVRVTAARGTRDGNVFELTDARLTSSDAVPPQFEILSRRLRVRVGAGGALEDVDRVTAEDARLQLYGTTVLGIGQMTVGPGGLLLPRVGVNSTEGLFVERSFAFGLRPFRLTLTPRIGTQTVVSGRARLSASTPVGTFEAIGSEKERHLLVVDERPVQYSRIPEFGWKAPPWEPPGIGGRLDARLSYGQYDEEGNATEWRHAADLWYRNPAYRGATTRLSWGAQAHYGYYSTGDEYGFLRGDVSFAKAFGYRLYVELGLSSHYIIGTTPFDFDRVEIATQANTLVKLRVTPHWIVKTSYVVDLNSRALRSSRYGVAYRDRLLEYGVSVRATPEFEFSIDARVLGF